MDIAVLGTGTVGRALAGRLDELGHRVVVGTRDPAATLARDDGPTGLAAWQADHPQVAVLDFVAAADHGELVVNATAGVASLDVLREVGDERLADKVLLDVANPLDFSNGMPPTLSVANDDSLGEQLQRALPSARVVKALNTMNADVMVDPTLLSGSHDVFVAGDDDAAKAIVVDLLRQFGWPEQDVVDLGGIAAARGAEMYLPLWLALWGVIGGPHYNIKVVRA